MWALIILLGQHHALYIRIRASELLALKRVPPARPICCRFRQCFLTGVIMTICWISNVLMSFLDETSGFLNAAIILEALQGVFIVAVFTVNHYGTNYVERRRNREQTALPTSL
jgi:hypothetical protein